MSGIRVVPNYYSENDNLIDVKGCMSFIVINQGGAKAILYGIIELLPNQSIPFPNIADLPYLENVQLSFEDITAEKKLLVIKGIQINNTKNCVG